MFASLKNKIREETGNDVAPLSVSRTRRSRPESLTSASSIDEMSVLEQKDAELNATRLELQELTGHLNSFREAAHKLEQERANLEQANKTLETKLGACQVQQELQREEQDKIQNFQQQEISKLKSMLLFREQEAVDRIAHQKNAEQQVESLRQELARLRGLEPMLENAQDELENLRHSSQCERNNLMSTLAAVEETNRHLKSRIQVLEDTRVSLTSASGTGGSTDDKIQCLLKERLMLEERLHEAHLHLSDIKSKWSGQNMTLETQVNRLSRQVAEETTEKHKALKLKDELIEKLKQLEFELEKLRSEVTQRDNKIKLMNEEIDELHSALREAREQHEEEVTFMTGKVEQLQAETSHLRTNLTETEQRLLECLESADRSSGAYQGQLVELENSVRELNHQLAGEKQEKLAVLMKNAEMSQQEEILRQELRHEKDESIELHDRAMMLQRELDKRLNTVNELRKQVDELMTTNLELNAELVDKNKIIKILNQRLVDMKKTLQEELKGQNSSNSNHHQHGHSGPGSLPADRSSLERSKSFDSKSIVKENGSLKPNGTSDGPPVVMDEVNFRYLKHVIIKFLTSREVEARHLIKAVSTLLQLSYEEEKLLHDTLNWKMSWFGSRPGQVTLPLS
ncbi:golgin subfamily A member 1 [Anopheles ziemanni]|uniref:golgin subfamily A member 1 n=1 Tax=Anopheles coustani TaxID=139045 RepID=UPI00265AEB08|nr:golgin subfamily A member 1 [Anopheles coustani]XP_058174904.1 golgin subfamily A member 1 [Anopheles ziemanni]